MPADQEKDDVTGEELAASLASQTEPVPRGSPPTGTPATLGFAEGRETTREERNAPFRGSVGTSPTTHAGDMYPAVAARELWRRAGPKAERTEEDSAAETDPSPVRPAKKASWRAGAHQNPSKENTGKGREHFQTEPALTSSPPPSPPATLADAGGGETTQGEQPIGAPSCGSVGTSAPTLARSHNPGEAARDPSTRKKCKGIGGTSKSTTEKFWVAGKVSPG